MLEDILVRIRVVTQGLESLKKTQQVVTNMANRVRASVTKTSQNVKALSSDLTMPFDQWRSKVKIAMIASEAVGKQELKAANLLMRHAQGWKTLSKTLTAGGEAYTRLQRAIMTTLPIINAVRVATGKSIYTQDEYRSLLLFSKQSQDEFWNSVYAGKLNLDVLKSALAKTGGTIKGLNTNALSLGDRFRLLTHGMRGFRMELLSTMFFGMALQRVFMGLLDPALKAAGVFDLIGAVLEVTFLPIAIVLLEVLLPIADWFINLPDNVKLAIGALVLIIGVAGAVLAAISMLGLGLGGLTLALGGTGTAAGAAGGGLLGIIPAIGGVLAALAPLAPLILGVIAVLGLLWLAWQTNFANIREFFAGVAEAIGNILKGLSKVFEGVFDIIIGIVNLDADKVMEGFKKMASGIYTIVVEGFGRILYEIIAFAVRVVEAIANGIRGAIDWFARLPGFIWNVLTRLPGLIIEIVYKIFEKIGLVPQGFAEAARKAVDSFMSFIRELPGKVYNELKKIPVIGDLIKGGEALIGGIAHFLGLQEGGIVTRPTVALVGERGPEAVLPLHYSAGGYQLPIAPAPTNVSIHNTINVSAEIASSYDVSRLADDLERELSYRFERKYGGGLA